MKKLEVNDLERWKQIKGYEQLYEISDHGRVRRIFFINKTTAKPKTYMLKNYDNGHGYRYISLSKGGKRKNFYIHRLVADHFAESALRKNDVNHKDFNKDNNYYGNLEWVTTKENIEYSAFRMRKQKAVCKISNTGEKYIHIKNGKFRVAIKTASFDRLYRNIQDAVFARDFILASING